jgi:hypothetical protein
LPFRSAGSRADAPFLISVGIYAGRLYLALFGDGRSIVGFEGSFARRFDSATSQNSGTCGEGSFIRTSNRYEFERET